MSPQHSESEKKKVLLIEDDEGEYYWVSEQLKECAPSFELTWKNTLADGLEYLSKEQPDAVLLDLFLPDSQGIESFKTFHHMDAEVPIVILTGLNDEESSLAAVRSGAQDYLIKGEVDGKGLVRVIQYAMKRNEVRQEINNQRLLDQVTGFYNKDGFLAMAERHLRLSHRANKGFFVILVVLDNLTDIAESTGQSEEKHALSITAKIIEETFRTSDLIARLENGRFAVITSDTSPHTPKMFKHRLKKSQAFYNSQFNRYKLALSVCAAHVSLDKIKTIADLQRRLDELFHAYQLRPGVLPSFAPSSL